MPSNDTMKYLRPSDMHAGSLLHGPSHGGVWLRAVFDGMPTKPKQTVLGLGPIGLGNTTSQCSGIT